MDLVKRSHLPLKERFTWAEEFLAFILSRLAESGVLSTVYAEPSTYTGPVDFKMTQGRDKTLTKNREVKTIAQYGAFALNRFVTYLLKTVLEKDTGGVGAGVFTVSFKDEYEHRAYCLYARRSGALGDCFQIDEIKHL